MAEHLVRTHDWNDIRGNRRKRPRPIQDFDQENEMPVTKDFNRNLTSTDRHRLRVRTFARRQETPLTEQIDWLLAQAEIVYSEDADADLVTMNSTVRLCDVNSGAERVCTLVYPESEGLIAGGVSVFSTLGTALIGCREGDIVICPERDRQRRLRVVEIRFQPERIGAYHL